MLKDITIGQFFPGHSIIHRLDPRVKLILTIAFIVMLFMAGSFYGLAVGMAFVLLSFALSGIPFRMMLKSLRPIMPILIFTAVLNIFFIKTGDVWFHWRFITITQNGVVSAVFIIIRIVGLIVGSSLLTYTTSPIQLTDAIERLFAPIKPLRRPVHDLAMMMTIALRFIPTLIEETDKIMAAQKARGADMESGNLVKKARALVPIFVPLIVSSFKRAMELALAMECRCYHGGEGRTRMKQMKTSLRDYASLALTAVFIAGVVFADKLGPKVF